MGKRKKSVTAKMWAVWDHEWEPQTDKCFQPDAIFWYKRNAEEFCFHTNGPNCNRYRPIKVIIKIAKGRGWK